eukprot:6470246-Amphidinium_carterae.1
MAKRARGFVHSSVKRRLAGFPVERCSPWDVQIWRGVAEHELAKRDSELMKEGVQALRWPLE